MSALRDAIERFAGKNAQVLGVSTDDLETNQKFAKSLNLPFPLASDPKGVVADEYGVKMAVIGLANRVTFVIDGDGKVVKVLEGKDAFDPALAADACPLHKKDKG